MKLTKLCVGSSVDHNAILASQMWCLGRFLPLMICSHMPRDEEKWGLFLTLLEIVNIIFADTITLDKAAYLWDRKKTTPQHIGLQNIKAGGKTNLGDLPLFV